MSIFNRFNLKCWVYSFLFFSLLFLLGKFVDVLIYQKFSEIINKGIINYLIISYLISFKWILYWTVLTTVVYSYSKIRRFRFVKYKELIVKEVPVILIFAVTVSLLDYYDGRYLAKLWFDFLNIHHTDPVDTRLQRLVAIWIGISFVFLYFFGSSFEYSRYKVSFEPKMGWMIIVSFFSMILFVKVWIVSYPNFAILIFITASALMLILALVSTRKALHTDKLDYYGYYWHYIDNRIYYFDNKYLTRTDEMGRSLLFMAVNISDKDLITFLLKKGFDIDHKDNEGNTPLIDCVKKYPDKEIMELLIEKGANPFVTDTNGESLLSWVFKTNKVDEAKYLIHLGLNINHIDNDGNTILHKISWGTSVEMVELLIKSGADINAQNQSETTPLMEAVFTGNIEVIKVLIDHGADLNITDENSYSALHFAVSYCSPEIVELLISKGADVNAKDKKGRTPLDIVHCPRKGKLDEKIINLLQLQNSNK